MAEIGRNQSCPCGSGLKYKRCCALKSARMSTGSRVMLGAIALILIGGAAFMLSGLRDNRDGTAAPARVWHGDHWDYPGRSH